MLKTKLGKNSRFRYKFLVIFLFILLLQINKTSFIYSYSDDVQSYNYDLNGRLIYKDSRSERVCFQYDLQGNLVFKYSEAQINGLYGAKYTGKGSSGLEEYSNTQGLGNWYYQQWDGTKYTDLSYKNGQWEGTTPYTLINKDLQHPAETDSVRKWVAPTSGLVRVAGKVAKSSSGGGDGVKVNILKNNIQLWSKTIGYKDTVGYEVGLTIAVNAGDAIYFVVNKNGDNAYDSISWKPVIAYMEAHSATEEYSNTQGLGNWYYQQWDGTKYTDLSYKNGQWEGTTPYTLINKDLQHPAETDSVRKWVAPTSGLVRIAGNVAKSSSGGGDGVKVNILKNNIQLWSKTIGYKDTIGYEVGLTIAVNAGDAIYFVVNKNGDNAYDSISWKPVIAYMEAHSATEEYSNTQGLGNWYYQQWDGIKYTDLSFKNGQWEGTTPYTLINKDLQHPAEMDSVRKWVAPNSGLIRIAGNVAKSSSGGGDGVKVNILKNNIQLWSKTIGYKDTIGYEVGLTVAVNAGDAIYFVVNKNGDSFYDSTSWKPVIAYMDAHSATEEYSNTQGLGNWYYQQWDGTKYTDLNYKNGQWEGTTPYTLINKDLQHPAETDSVRKWVAPTTGLVRIAGNVAKSSSGGGDGVKVNILKNNIQLWSKTLGYKDTIGYEVGLTVAVSAGDTIYFVVNKNGDSFYDSTSWKPVIAFID